MTEPFEPVVTTKTEPKTKTRLQRGFYRVIQGFKVNEVWHEKEIFRHPDYGVCCRIADLYGKEDGGKTCAIGILDPDGNWMKSENPEWYNGQYIPSN